VVLGGRSKIISKPQFLLGTLLPSFSKWMVPLEKWVYQSL